MPYIPQHQRDRLDHDIDTLANKLTALTDHCNPAFAGVLNYTITTLILKTIPVKRYCVIALITGVLHNIIDEFYRRYAVPYEDQKIDEHGDCYPQPS